MSRDSYIVAQRRTLRHSLGAMKERCALSRATVATGNGTRGTKHIIDTYCSAHLRQHLMSRFHTIYQHQVHKNEIYIRKVAERTEKNKYKVLPAYKI